MKKLYTTLFASLFFVSFLIGQAANDDCANAIAIGDTLDMEFSTIDATTDGPYHEDSPCPSSSEEGQDSVYNDIWYAYTPTFSGNAEFTLCSTANFDTKIAVYNAGATCPLEDGDLLDCNEDGANCANSTSSLIFTVEAGETYLLRLGGFGETSPGQEGSGTFSVSQFISTVANDFCSDAEVAQLGVNQPFSNTGTITDGPDHPGNSTCFGFNFETASNDIWYTYTPDFTGSVIWSTCNSISFDSRLAVYGPNATCPVEDGDLYACNDDGAGCEAFSSRLFFDVEEGMTYLLRLGSFNNEVGDGTFDLLNENPPEPPSNDLCETPIEIPVTSEDDVVEINGTTINSTFDSDTYFFPSCLGNTTGGEFADVYFNFNSEGFPEIEVNLASITGGAAYFIDVLPACDTPSDTTAFSSDCFFHDSAVNPGLLTDTIRTFPDVGTDYILRVSTRVTTDPPGDFIIWMVGRGTTSVEDDEFFGETTFTPNPIYGTRGTVTANLKEGTDMKIRISDITGKVISESVRNNLRSGKNSIEVEFPDDAKGVYFVTLQSEKLLKSIKVVKM